MCCGFWKNLAQSIQFSLVYFDDGFKREKRRCEKSIDNFYLDMNCRKSTGVKQKFAVSF